MSLRSGANGTITARGGYRRAARSRGACPREAAEPAQTRGSVPFGWQRLRYQRTARGRHVRVVSRICCERDYMYFNHIRMVRRSESFTRHRPDRGLRNTNGDRWYYVA